MVKLARNEQCITLHPLTAHNEQCITLYPLRARYSVGPFPAHVIFRPSQSPFILGLISSIRLLMLLSFCAYGPNSARGYSRPVCGPLIRWAVFIASSNTYDLLMMTRYGRPMNGRFQL